MQLKTKSFIFLTLCIFLISGCRKPPQDSLRSSPIRNSNKNFTTKSEKKVTNEHPYGNPFTGKLPWETATEFQTQRNEIKATVRMAAFKTTLPNPLPGEESNVAQAADYLAGQTVEPGQTFSLFRIIGPFSKARGYREGPAYVGTQVIKTTGGGVCKIASTLYNVAILANLKIIERHAHSMQVPYVPPGQDATISTGVKDLLFMNKTTAPLMIWADTRGNSLYMAIYGSQKPPRITWNHQILKRWPTHTVYQNSKNLKPGDEKVIVPGADGLQVKSWLTIEYPDGRVEQKKIGIDWYKPLPNVIEKGE